MKRSLSCLLLSAALLFALELVLRLARGGGTLTYEYAEQSYHALVPELAAHGARPLAVIGSSRAREALLMPTLQRAMAARGVDVLAGNYAMSGARADAVNQTLRHLLRADPLPRLVVYGVTPLQLETRATNPDSQVALNWTLPDAWDAHRRGAPDVLRYVPSAVKNHVANVSLVVRLRPLVRRLALEPPEGGFLAAAETVFTPPDESANPLRGKLPKLKQGAERDRVIRVSAKRVRTYLRDRYTEPEWPHTYQAVYVRDTIERCRAAGVPIVLVELPAAPSLRRHLPDRAYEGFYELFRALSREHDVPFLELDELDTEFGQGDFREQSHLNYRGARRFTEAVAAHLPTSGLAGGAE